MIQHSFGLLLAKPHRPFFGHTSTERIQERFVPRAACDPYFIEEIPVIDALSTGQGEALHSPLAEHSLTTVGSLPLKYLREEARLPSALGWAEKCCSDCGEPEIPRFVFADSYDDEWRPTYNDFMVGVSSRDSLEGARVSQALLEVLAHKRSRLFGVALANRFVNVMLPHAVLHRQCSGAKDDAWLVHPLVSFIRGGRDRDRLRGTYALSLFFVPVKGAASLASRKMHLQEVKGIVDAGWGYAASPPPDARPKFFVSGPLFDYLSRLARFDLRAMRSLDEPRSSCGGDDRARRDRPFTVRQAVERIAFGIGLSLSQGRTGRSSPRATRLLGNQVIMALGSARVSSVVAVDPGLKSSHVRRAPESGAPIFPRKLSRLMEELAKSGRAPAPSDEKARKYRLDHPFVDSDLYAIGVLPTKRCMVVVSCGKAQCGTRESALMQAGSVAYMTIGTATGIGTMREIDRRLEHLEDARNPKKIAAIDAEIASDLGEIYDLDITRESYREVYRLLRKRFGITRDYKILQSKMQSLYRATSTVHEDNAQRLLLWLTVALAVLTVLLLIVGILTVVNS